MNHYPRHVGDITRDTFGLSLTEFGAYDRLLDAYYATEKPIPHAERYRLTGAVSKADKAAVDYVISRYFVQADDGLHQKRADTEIAKYRERSASASASANARWSERNANAMRTHSEGSANQEPVTKNHKAKREIRAPISAPTDEHRSIASELRLDCDVEWLKYRDQQANAPRKHSDLQAGFRNWLRRAKEFKPQPRAGPATTAADRRSDVADQMYRRGKYAVANDTERDITGSAERVG